ncbi:MAG: ketopantoate reductase family protein, partial [Promethearchaeota archaeon]
MNMLNKNKLRFGFIGAGSIGSLFGGLLASVKRENFSIEIIFFGRKEHCQEIMKRGLEIQSHREVLKVRNIIAYDNLKLVEEIINEDPNYHFNFLFISTKTFDLENSLIQYKNIIDSSSWVIILQNGIGNKEIVSQFCEKEKIIRIITSHGAFIKNPGQIYHAGSGFTKIGFSFIKSDKLKSIFNVLELLRNLLNSSGLETEIVDDINIDCWEKVLVNIGINALGAITRLKNGQLLENGKLKSLMKELVLEALIVAKKQKIKLPQKDYVRIMYQVAEKTSNNLNSMLQDVLKNKITEIDF